MALISLYINLIIGGAFWSAIFKKSIGKTISLTLFIDLLISFLLGIINLLSFSIYVIIIITIIQFIYCVYYYLSNKNQIKKLLLKPSIIIITFLFLTSYFLFKYYYIKNWDEFSHWALYSKNVFYYNSLWASSFTSVSNGYPPITAIFQYLLNCVNRYYNEANLIRATYLLATIPIASILDDYDEINYKFKIALSIIIFFLPTISFINFYDTIYVDIILGTLGASLITNILTEKDFKFKLLYSVLISSILILTKEFGIIFYLVGMLIFFYDYILKNKLKITENSKTIKKRIIIILILLLPILCKILWSHYYSSISNNLGQISDLKYAWPEWGWTTISAFFQNMFTMALVPGSNNFTKSPFTWLFVITIALFITRYFVKKDEYKSKVNKIIFSLYLLAFVYCGALLYSYLFLFGKYESTRVYSLDRYMSTIMLAIYIIYLCSILYFTKKEIFKNNIPIYLCIFLSIYLLNITSFTNLVFNVASGNSEKNKIEYNKTLEQYDSIYYRIEENAKVFYVSKCSNGLDYWKFRYYLTPKHIQKDNFMWSIGTACNDADIWTNSISKEDFISKISDYNYLFLQMYDENFKNEFGDIFENKKEIVIGGLYKINVEKKLKLQLIK